MIRFRLVFTLLLGACFVGGCESGGIKPDGGFTASLDLTATKTSISAKVGNVVKVELPPVELAGYGWQVFQLDSRYLKQLTEVTPPPAKGGRSTISFMALRAVSKTTVRFLLVKLDKEKETQPVDGHDAIFSIDL